MLWLILGILGLLAAGILLVAMLRRPSPGAARAEYDLEVFRAQLREVEREVERGVLGAAEADAARTEIERRMLAADAARRARAGRGPAGSGMVLAAVVAAAVPAAALGLYLVLGSPGTPSATLAERGGHPPVTGAPGQPDLPDLEVAISRLEQRLAQNPEDLQGWIMLGRTYVALGRHARAVEAFDRAVAIDGSSPFLHSARGEALMMAADGQVTEAARAAFAQALAADPGDVRARYYLAVAKQQDGDAKGALDALVALLDGAPADAPWRPGVREHASDLALELGLNPDSVLPAAPSAMAEPPGDPRAAAEALAARLQANPKDYQGWIELARARVALGDAPGARAALDRGAEAYAGAPFVQQQFAQAAAELGLTAEAEAPRGPSAEDAEAVSQMSPQQQETMIRDMVGGLAERLKSAPNDLRGWQMLARSYGVLNETEKAVEAYRHVLTLDATDQDALFFLGDAARRNGDTAAAVDYWTRLLGQLAPGSAQHTMLQDRIKGLTSAN